MPEVTGLLMAAALRPADVLGDHGQAAGRSHSLPFAPRPHFRPSGAMHFLVQARLTAGNPVSRALPVRNAASVR